MRFSNLSLLAVLSAANAEAALGNRHTDLNCNSHLHEPIAAGKCYRIDRTRTIFSFGAMTCKEYPNTDDCSGSSKSNVYREGCHGILQQGKWAPRSLKCSPKAS
ncbi:hypothetical protein LMH87_000118 [Akanthomyces muscarius]|uniref:Uncharacterized protein n=1 Tax=Akanthomyces muscarius TaxID=2231603 RepID=A0A9W8QHA6_AKAMU|nr:hypothetical protein LMH87_000118 [Akanthomyces muscarius]KAJ4154843.1 hypothetical protein LMH87_000118 [Akanthomyces muscarius]